MKPVAPSHRLRRWILLRPRFWLLVGILFLLGLAVRVALPSVLKHFINQRLAQVEGYLGQVEDIDLQLFRGAYRMKAVSILKRDGTTLEPFFSAGLVDFSLAWGELFHGRLVSDIELRDARLQLTKSGDPVDAGEEGRRWQEVINDLFPIEITHLEIARSELSFVDATSTPRVNLFIRDLHAVATGLRNRSTSESGPYPASLTAEGVTLGDGNFQLFIQGEPLAENPHFILKLDLQRVALPALNDFLEAYANVDVSAGTFQLYMEMSAADGGFEGYIKPFFENLEFKNIADQNKGIMRRFWEKIVSGVTALLKNDQSNQVATRIPFSGNFQKTEVGIWATIVNLLRNGFGKAFFEGRDDEPPPSQAAKTDSASPTVP